jgi:toxin ParE1/3/4
LEACGGAGSIARRLILSVEAEADLDRIFSSGIEQWGVDLADAYRQRLNRAFSGLLEHPGRGPPFDPALPGLHSMKAGEHRIYYSASNDTVRVARILHHAMDAPRRLSGA